MSAAEDYRANLAVKAKNGISKNRGKKFKKNLNTFSVVSNSDVSTTVLAPSQAARGPKNATCNSVNFGELGGIGAMITDTPRSKRSVDFGSRKFTAN